jgi:hypothetical protein
MTFLQKRVIGLLSIVVLLAVSGCRNNDDDNAPKTVDHTAVQYDAALAQRWMQQTYNAVKQQNMLALDGSRTYAYVAITLHEAVVHSFKNGRSLAGQLKGLNNLPVPDPTKEYNWGIVLCEAASKVLLGIIDKPTTATDSQVRSLAQLEELQLRTKYNPSAEVMYDSKEFAQDLADAILAWAANDNRQALDGLTYVMPTTQGNPQYYDGVGEPNPFFFSPFWWTSRPFVLNTYKICEPLPPYAYSTDPNSAYYKDVKEVYDASFDPAKVSIGKYWANNPGVSGTPAGSWIGIANQLVDQFKLDLPTTVRMYTRLAVSTRDAFIAVWYIKYRYNLQRPVSYIKNVMGHTNWTSPVPTPPYPDYVSGTSANAGSSSEILTRMFGDRAFSDAQHKDKFTENGFDIRQFSSFKAAGREAFHSRIYGGVHMRRACEEGFTHGECIANIIWNGLKFEK